MKSNRSNKLLIRRSSLNRSILIYFPFSLNSSELLKKWPRSENYYKGKRKFHDHERTVTCERNAFIFILLIHINVLQVGVICFSVHNEESPRIDQNIYHKKDDVEHVAEWDKKYTVHTSFFAARKSTQIQRIDNSLCGNDSIHFSRFNENGLIVRDNRRDCGRSCCLTCCLSCN